MNERNNQLLVYTHVLDLDITVNKTHLRVEGDVSPIIAFVRDKGCYFMTYF